MECSVVASFRYVARGFYIMDLIVGDILCNLVFFCTFVRLFLIITLKCGGGVIQMCKVINEKNIKYYVLGTYFIGVLQ